MIMIRLSRMLGMRIEQATDLTAPIDLNLARASVVLRAVREIRTTVRAIIIVASSNTSSSVGTTLSKLRRISINNRSLMSRGEPRMTICGEAQTAAYELVESRKSNIFPILQVESVESQELTPGSSSQCCPMIKMIVLVSEAL